METVKKLNNQAVLIVNLSKWFGGAEVRTFDLAALLEGKVRYAVAVLEGSPLHERLKKAGLPSIPFSYGRGDVRLLFALREAIQRNGFSIVDAHNPQSQFWGLLAGMAESAEVLVSTVHSSYGDTDKGLKKLVYELVLRINKAIGCKFIAVSESVNEYLQKLGVPSEIISLVHNSIAIPEAPSQRQYEGIRRAAGWGKDDFVFAVVGRLELVKGHIYLLEAISKAIKQNPAIRCLIVGTGRLQAELEAKVKEYNIGNHVLFAGFRDDVKELLISCDAFCMPSLSEGMPYALLEACVSALPILATNVGGIVKLIEHGKTGLLVPPQDSGALADSLVQLAGNPEYASRLGVAAFEMVRERLSSEKMLSGTLQVYGFEK
ncbi:MAG: glycosyltransferase family 4 protein [Nitrospirae bacterium]|nr:glycosyltransferase family 4 protein [Nitrospirota bacterium]